MKQGMNVVIIGGVAAGPKCAARIRRMDPTAEITIIERGEFLSYAGCGLPYYVSGKVKEQKELMSTPIGVMRDPAFFKNAKNVHVLNHTTASEIDRAGKRVQVENGGSTRWIDYDTLVLATGTSPVVPDVPGMDLRNIFTLQKVEDAEGIKALLAREEAEDVVVVGSGLIGLEMVEALVECGARMTLAMRSQVWRLGLDWEMAHPVQVHMQSHGVRVVEQGHLEGFKGNGAVEAVIAGGHEIPCDMVLVGISVSPNVELAAAAGLQIGDSGAIKVDAFMRTNDPNIYAAGDCAEVTHMVGNIPLFISDGATANKQGRLAATNICGGKEAFPGVVGTAVCKVFDFNVARTGLIESKARELGFDAVSCLAPGLDKAHYYPGAKLVMLKMIADRATRKLLGVQAVGPGEAAKRVDIAAVALMAGMTVDQMANLDLAYAPPYSSALDNIITAANILRNKLDGLMDSLGPMELKKRLDAGEDLFLLDVRTPREYEEVHLDNSTLIPLGQLGSRVSELPTDKTIVVFCKISLRGYEAARLLHGCGLDNVLVLDGGIAMWPYEKVTG